jgi:hypothetical protein
MSYVNPFGALRPADGAERRLRRSGDGDCGALLRFVGVTSHVASSPDDESSLITSIV